MNTTLAAMCSIPGAGRVMTPRRADARLAPGGRKGPRERDTPVARTPPTDEAARWQLILDLLDPDKCCGAWSPATVQGRPVVCTRAPHHVREEHANAETGWRWYDDDWPFPARWRGTRDFGPSKFGRYPRDAPCYSGRRVDLLGRSLRVEPGADLTEAIRRYLTVRRTRSAKELAAKAVVLIDPESRVGEIVWPGANHTS